MKIFENNILTFILNIDGSVAGILVFASIIKEERLLEVIKIINLFKIIIYNLHLFDRFNIEWEDKENQLMLVMELFGE